VQVMDVNRILYGLISEFISGAVRETALDPGSRKEISKSVVVMIPPILHIAPAGYCHVGRIPSDAMLNECRPTSTVAIGSREKSSQSASGITSASA
jgi:hypothetical protein